MYCTTCGKQIIDTARFCNYCGSPVAFAPNPAPVSAPIGDNAVTEPAPTETASAVPEDLTPTERTEPGVNETEYQAPSVNEQSEQTVLEDDSVIQSEQTAFDNTLSAQAEPSVSDNISETQAESAYRLPAPSPIPINGESAAFSEQSVKKPLPERKYTLGHLMMCLCAVAIMAIVAGVFAGLYFSVV